MLRAQAKWLFTSQRQTRCAACGATLIAYLPRCRACGASVDALMSREIECQPDCLEKAAGAIRVAHLSDLHIGQAWVPAFRPQTVFRRWLDVLREAQTDVVVVSGDIIDRPGDQLGLQLGRGLLDACGMPWVVAPGNHDVKRPGHHDVFNDVFGEYPRVEEHAGVEFIVLDSMAGLPIEQRDVAERLYGDYVCYTEGRVGERQLERVDGLIKARGMRPAHRALVLHHHVMRQHADFMPLVPQQMGMTEDAVGTMKTLIDAETVIAWALEREVQVIYHGHKHLFQQPGVRAGRLLVLNGGTSTLGATAQRGRVVDHLPDGSLQVTNLRLVI
jgi:predicted phosphodiesterase